jgi:AmmeMemoRadiSam system protein B/AmmeMemoRadiSam system protein A
MDDTVRNPAVAGQFYTGDPGALRAEIVRYLDRAETGDIPGEVVALVSPHAGYMYSGQVAAYGYRLVRGKQYDVVVVISPSHVESFDFNSVFPGNAYRTPLGDIPVDHELVRELAGASGSIRADMRGHAFTGFRGEHALEVQLPFLQVALDTFTLVPIVMGNQRLENVTALGEALGECLKHRNALIVASTDLSHFHNGQAAGQLDGIFIDLLDNLDPKGLYTALSSGKTEACGGGPTVAAMIAARKLGARSCRVLRYADSGDVTGDKSNVVGYVSAVMLSEPSAEKRQEHNDSSRKAPPPPPGSDLSMEDKIFLLTLARAVITAKCAGEEAAVEPSESPVMKELRGGFVTLKKEGQLRGCIGYIEAIKPLAVTIEEMAQAAAFNDYRFSPVEAAEVPDLEIEISVLSPITAIDDPETISVGRHGIIITRGPNRGLLLPQVATEWNWDRETFLEQTCVKAGLPRDAWKQGGTKIEVFSAEVFSERELGLR